MATNRASTRQLLVKIPNVACLYRHGVNQTYYGIKKTRGKRKEHSLETAERKLAERRLKEWIDGLDRIDAEAEKTTLAQLLDKFQMARRGMSKSTIDTERGMINKLETTWKYGINIQVSQIKPSMLDEWLAQHERQLKNSSYNRYTLFLKQLLEIATSDKMIFESPVDRLKKGWKRPQKPIRNVPTQDQFHAIVASIRSQRLNLDAEESSDFIEFLGLAGLGQAEASSITIEDIDWEQNRMRTRRRKTDQLFYVPIYPHLKVLPEKLCKKASASNPRSQKIFSIKDARKALTNACERLGLQHYSQRNMRQVLIRRLWQSGVDYKLISKWQGHQDGGKLILDTYTEVFGGKDADYEKAQLAKIQ
jgi:integrase